MCPVKYQKCLLCWQWPPPTATIHCLFSLKSAANIFRPNQGGQICLSSCLSAIGRNIERWSSSGHIFHITEVSIHISWLRLIVLLSAEQKFAQKYQRLMPIPWENVHLVFMLLLLAFSCHFDITRQYILQIALYFFFVSFHKNWKSSFFEWSN